MTGDSDKTWLIENRELRMDANVAHVSASRREFHKARYRFAARHIKGLNVLDGACGTGYGSAILGEQASSVTGIDLDPEAVAYANKHYGANNIKFLKSTVELTPFEKHSFDAVVSFETVEHTLSPEAHFREIVRILKPDGTAIMTIPNGWGLTDHHFFDFDLDLLKSFTERFFREVSYYSNNPPSNDPESNGIYELLSPDQHSECILAICKNPIKTVPSTPEQRSDFLLSDIYKNAFARHQEYLSIRKRFLYSGTSDRIRSLVRRARRRFQS